MKFSKQFLTAVRNDAFKGSYYETVTDYLLPAIVLWLGRTGLKFRGTSYWNLLEFIQIMAFWFVADKYVTNLYSWMLVMIAAVFFLDIVSRFNAILLRGLSDHVQRITAKVALVAHKRALAQEAGVLA